MDSYIREFLLDCELRGLSPRTTKGLRNILNSFNNYIKNEYVEINPMKKVKFVKEPKAIINTFNDEEVRKILARYLRCKKAYSKDKV